MWKLLLAIAVPVCACAHERVAPSPPPPATAPSANLVFGDCADTDAWVLGPRPMAFSRRDVKRPWVPRDLEDLGGGDAGDPVDLFADAFPSSGPVFAYGGGKGPGFPEAWHIRLRSAEGGQTKGAFRSRGGYENAVTECYRARLAQVPDLKGTLLVDVSIANDVATVATSGFDAGIGACVAKEMTRFFGAFGREPAGRLVFTITFWKRGDAEPDDEPIAHGSFRYPRDVPGEYAPGANPLRDRSAELARCVGQAHGGAVVDLATASVSGIADLAAAACVAAIAKQLHGTGHCGFAFGTTPLDALPPIDIDGFTVAIGGDHPVNGYQLMEAVAKRALAAPESLAIRLPFAIRATDATPAGLVIDELGYVVEAGDDAILATRRAGAWQPLNRYPLPVPPVPLGTGGHWAPFQAQGDARPTRETAALLVAKHHVWLATFGAAKDVVKMPRERAAALLRTARDRLAHDELAIGVAGEVTWGELVAVIDAAEAAGFRHWTLFEDLSLGRVPDEEDE